FARDWSSDVCSSDLRPGCGADLVRRDALRQHADLVPASAVRLRAVLSARRGAEGSEELGHLLGRDALDRAAGDHGGACHRVPGDRKSTRLNSSHVKISYAVFCLKKKKKK